jgi:glycosyltransferase involved in cell wall biosynthesis
MSLSIIIPTYNSVNFLDELFNSINKNKVDFPFEVLIGIDRCEKTKEYIKDKTFPPNFFFFYFLENVGPYKIKNTLSEVAKYDNLFFFDSDDIMTDSCLLQLNSMVTKYECIKPKFVNFRDDDFGRTYFEDKGLYGEGVFVIHKKLFLSMNGFEGWRCAADSDFMGRIYKMKRKINLTKNILFHRRLHPNSLTSSRETGYKSQIRSNYFRISKSKKDYGPLPTLERSDYQMLDNVSMEWSEPISVIELNEIESVKEMKNKKHQLLETIFQNSPKEVKHKEIKVIDYNKVNRITNANTSSVLGGAIRKAKLENLKKNYRGR